MKKLFVLFIMALSLVALPFSGALACGPSGCYHVEASAFGAGLDYDFKFIPNGAAGGIGGAIGGAHGEAGGCVFGGTVGGSVDVYAGGITTTDAYRFHVPGKNLSIGVGSVSQSFATTGGELNTWTEARWARNGGFISGFAAQGTLNGSYVGSSPLPMWESEGFSGGVAGQGSIGGFFGMTGRNGSVGADIAMEGGSYSESYRYINFGNGSKTEGMGTNVGAYTNVETSGYSECGRITGGYMAAGGAASMTVQSAPGMGGAEACAVGVYSGSGGLNSNYSGSAVGYTYTSVTTFNGMNGSINSAGASMSVHSSHSPN